MQRVFAEKDSIENGLLFIGGSGAHHLRDVLRMKRGEHILVSCGDEWEYTCEIADITDEGVTARVVDSQKAARELPSEVTLFQCLPKGDKMETVIQKAVELGAAEIVPVASSRCVVRLDEKKAASKVKRWNSIAGSAAEQSRRMIVPSVHEVLSFDDALDYARSLGCGHPDGPLLLIPYEKESGMRGTKAAFDSLAPGRPVCVLIGPEGGFDEREVEKAEGAGFVPISLGSRILRTETAGMTALSILMYLLELQTGL